MEKVGKKVLAWCGSVSCDVRGVRGKISLQTTLPSAHVGGG
jgi:hypothetical protein